MYRFVAAVVVCIPGLAAGAASAQGPEETYRSTFGEEGNSVLATPATKDDVEFAAKLLDAARQSSDLAAQAFLCEKALEFAGKAAEGFPVASQAARLLGEAAPDKRLAAADKFLGVCEALHARSRTEAEKQATGSCMLEAYLFAGDARLDSNAAEAMAFLTKAVGLGTALDLPQGPRAAMKLEIGKAVQEAERILAGAEEALKADPRSPAKAKRVGMMWLLERNSPTRAAEYLQLAPPEGPAQTLLPLAGKPLRGLDEGQCLQLAQWYRSLAAQAGGLAKWRALERADEYYRRVQEQHSLSGPASTRTASDAVFYDLARAQADVGGGWIDLLALRLRDKDKAFLTYWDSNDSGAITKGDFKALSALPYGPPREYDLHVWFTSHMREGPVGVVFPVGLKQVAFIMGDKNNTKTGLANVNRLAMDSARNPTLRNIPIVLDRTYSVRITVRRTGVGVFLDRDNVVQLATDGSNLDPQPSWTLTTLRVPGIGGIKARTVFHSVWAKEVTGKGALTATQPAR